MTRPPEGAFLPAGKLPVDRLRAMLATLVRHDPRLLVGPRPGEDAAVLEMGDRCLVVTTDPVTFAADRIGWYAVHVNANDVAVMGARPRWFFAVVLLPEAAATGAMADSIMNEIAAACDDLGATVCGGHTEITTGLGRPIVVGQMLGEVPRDRLVKKGALRVGDRVLMTGGAAIEGTAILATELPGKLQGRVPDAVLARARNFLADPGISVVAAALASAEAGGVHAMHDPTEGGVLTGLHELATSAGTGLRAFGDRIPVHPETRAVCTALGIDPLGLIASGALLIGAPPSACGRIAGALERLQIPVAEVGEIVRAEEGVTLESGGGRRQLVPPDRDELARVLEAECGKP